MSNREQLFQLKDKLHRQCSEGDDLAYAIDTLAGYKSNEAVEEVVMAIKQWAKEHS